MPETLARGDWIARTYKRPNGWTSVHTRSGNQPVGLFTTWAEAEALLDLLHQPGLVHWRVTTTQRPYSKPWPPITLDSLHTCDCELVAAALAGDLVADWGTAFDLADDHQRRGTPWAYLRIVPVIPGAPCNH